MCGRWDLREEIQVVFSSASGLQVVNAVLIPEDAGAFATGSAMSFKQGKISDIPVSEAFWEGVGMEKNILAQTCANIH
jgi:hypothetical protein